MLEIRNVCFQYSPDGPLVLDNFSMTLQTGGVTGLCGPSGAGKSTLCRIIAGHLRPGSGRVYLGNTDITSTPSRRVLLIHQDDDLFPWLTSDEQVMLAQASRDRELAIETLESVGLAGATKKKPNEMSGGMRKRLALARALAARPDLIIFDESFSSLDTRMKEEIFSLLERTCQQEARSILMVSHLLNDLYRMTDNIFEFSAARALPIARN